MNLKTIAASAVAKAFSVASSIVRTCTYRQASAPAYDASAGTVTPNNTDTTFNALFTHYTAKEGASPAMREGEQRVIVKRSELPGIAPAQSDRIIDGGTTWEIVGISDDSTEPVWSFVVKRGQA